MGYGEYTWAAASASRSQKSLPCTTTIVLPMKILSLLVFVLLVLPKDLLANFWPAAQINVKDH